MSNELMNFNEILSTDEKLYKFQMNITIVEYNWI